MSIPVTTFDTAKWHRVKVEFPFEKRPCRIEDMEGLTVLIDGALIDFTGDEFKAAMTLPNVWKAKYPKWQQALDSCIMQKMNYAVTVKKTCSADSIDLINMYSKLVNKTSLEYFYGESASTIITYVWADRTNASEYVIDSPFIEDHGNGTCTVTAKFYTYGEWEVVQRDPSVAVN